MANSLTIVPEGRRTLQPRLGTLPPRRVFVLVFSLKFYALLLLYILFLKTDLRNGDKGFFFRPEGQPLNERTEDVQASFFERLAPYDGQWYLDIAANGYRRLEKVESNRGRHPPGNYAFFPLLPAVIKGARAVFEESYLPATLLLGVFLSALGAVALWALARDLGVAPYLTVVLLLSFPTAVFQFALYTEGIFLLLSALTLIFSLRRKPLLAAIAAALAGLTRPQGILSFCLFSWSSSSPS